MNKKQIIKTLLIGLFGGVCGYFISKLSLEVPDLEPIINLLVDNIKYFMLLPTVLGIWALITFVGIRNKIKADNYSDEENSVYELKQHMLQMTMSAGTMTHILNFLFAGINLYYIVEVQQFSDNIQGGLMTFALINAILAMYIEVANINLVKRMEPEKNADPTSFKYNQQAIDTLDERELIIAGKATLKTEAIMPLVYAAFFVIGITVLASPIYFVGLLVPWGINVTVKTIYLIKEKKGK